MKVPKHHLYHADTALYYLIPSRAVLGTIVRGTLNNFSKKTNR